MIDLNTIVISNIYQIIMVYKLQPYINEAGLFEYKKILIFQLNISKFSKINYITRI